MKRSFYTPLFLRYLLFTLVFLVYGYADGQNAYASPASYTYGRGMNNGEGFNSGGNGNRDEGRNNMTSNVPLNEINIRAFRHFQKRYPLVSGESWLKTDGGYVVSFMENARRNQAHYDLKGGFLYTIQYYSGMDIPADAAVLIKKYYSAYSILVVTGITDGEKTFWLAKIVNPSSVKTVSICDGKIELVEDLVNGG